MLAVLLRMLLLGAVVFAGYAFWRYAQPDKRLQIPEAWTKEAQNTPWLAEVIELRQKIARKIIAGHAASGGDLLAEHEVALARLDVARRARLLEDAHTALGDAHAGPLLDREHAEDGSGDAYVHLGRLDRERAGIAAIGATPEERLAALELEAQRLLDGPRAGCGFVATDPSAGRADHERALGRVVDADDRAPVVTRRRRALRPLQDGAAQRLPVAVHHEHVA